MYPKRCCYELVIKFAINNVDVYTTYGIGINKSKQYTNLIIRYFNEQCFQKPFNPINIMIMFIKSYNVKDSAVWTALTILTLILKLWCVRTEIIENNWPKDEVKMGL